MTRRLLLPIVLLLVGLSGLFGLPAALATPPALIAVTESGFSPSTITVTVGSQVTWLNETDATVRLRRGWPQTGGETMSGQPTMPPGGTFAYTFRAAGRFRYSAAQTQWRGMVIVQPATPTPTATPTEEPTATPIPPIPDETLPTDVGSSTEFLYEGENPVQTGVVSGTIETERAAVLRGTVRDGNGTPLAGVAISILDQPDLGQTVTQADGHFDMAVNGGGVLTVQYDKAGFLPAQRQIEVPWRDYALLPDVALLPLDLNVTTIDPAAPTMQVARGSVVSDADGTRQSTLLVAPGTQAQIVLPDGTTQTLSDFHVRATEYTVGEDGPEAMPGTLPATSGYTYAVEWSVDEALAAGATTVEFSQPVLNYLENFLGFPVGGTVPTGYYDRERGVWVASDNGRVLKVLTVAGGSATLDTNGDGAADDAATLAALGITPAEQQALATLYPAGQELWRVPLPHFTSWDHNWPYGPTPGAQAPNLPRPDASPSQPNNDTQCGSIIFCQNQSLGERVDLFGTPFRLHYSSERVPDFAARRSLDITLTGATVPPGLKAVSVNVEVAGQFVHQTFAPQPNQRFHFTWDGNDAFGRPMQGQVPARVSVGYTYDLVYQTPAQLGQAFAAASGAYMSVNREQAEVSIAQAWTVPLSRWNERARGLGGWSLDAHHAYDGWTRTLYRGDGEQLDTETTSYEIIKTVAGNGQLCGSTQPCGDGGPATAASFYDPHGVVAAPDGGYYVSDWGRHRIRHVSPDGTISTVAGTGTAGFSGDGGPATAARINLPTAIALGPDGSVFFSDSGNRRVRRIAPDGTIWTVAGNGQECAPWPAPCGDGGPATDGQLRRAEGLAVSPTGDVYLTDRDRIRRVTASGLIVNFAGSSIGSAVPGPVSEVRFRQPLGLAMGPDGSLYVADSGNHVVRRIGLNGLVTDFAGNGNGCSPDTAACGDGGPALLAMLNTPVGVTVGPDGGVYISDVAIHRVRLVEPDSTISTIAGTGVKNFSGDGGPAKQARLFEPYGLAVMPDGALLIADRWNDRIRQVESALPGLGAGEVTVPAQDGSELYIFNGQGRHLRTLDALTGSVRYTFAYDAEGRLGSVTDGNNLVTTIERDGAGNPTAIVAPYGQRTELTLDPNGYLATVSNPASETISLSYSAGGLLQTLTDAKGQSHRFFYDALGRLSRDEAPAGTGIWTDLHRVTHGEGYTVTLTSATGQATEYGVRNLPDGGQERTTLLPGGLRRWWSWDADGILTTEEPDGTVTTQTFGADPRWGMSAAVPTETEISTPGGLSRTTTVARSATLADPLNPFSLIELRQTLAVNGRAFQTVYNSAARTLIVTSPEGRTVTYTLDTKGRIVAQQVAGLAPVAYEYDAQGRLARVTQGTGGTARVTEYTYNAEGLVATLTDAMDRTLHFDAYDAAGRLLRRTLPDGRQVSFGYDANGNLVSVTPDGQPAHGLSWNGLDQLAGYNPPDVGGADETTYTTNADRQLSAVARPNGEGLALSYDAAGRLSAVALAEGTLTFGYDAATGNLASIAAPDGLALGYTFDGALLTGESWAGPVAGAVGYSYDNSFRLVAQSVNGDTVAFGYDDDALLVQAGALALSRDAGSSLVTGTTLGSVSTSHGFNAFGEPETLSVQVSGTERFHVATQRDALGRIVGITETLDGVTTSYSFGYGQTGRLEQVWQDGALVATYSYDGNGNRASVATPGGTESATFDAQDRQLTRGGATYSYDAAGDLVSQTTAAGATSYDYDALGNLQAVTLPDGTEIVYLVDGQNRRVGRLVNGTLQQGWLYGGALEPIAELDGAGNVVSRFVYGSRAQVPDTMVRDGVTYRIISDHVGSVRLVVNAATGEVAQAIRYDAWGVVLSDTNPGFQPFGFAGGLLDRDTGLTRFGLRDYDAASGRWTAKDPILFGGNQANLYVYVYNDPINFLDPRGTDPVMDGIGTAAGGIGAWQTATLPFAGESLGLIVGAGTGAEIAAATGGVAAAAAFGYGVGYGADHLYTWARNRNLGDNWDRGKTLGQDLYDAYEAIFDPAAREPAFDPQKNMCK